VLRWPGNFLHFIWLFLVVLFGGLLYGVARLGLALFVWGASRERTLASFRGWWLRTMMTALGATFIKLGQVMSTRPDLFRPEIIDQLRHLQDKLPPFSFAKVKQTIEAELGKPWEHPEVYMRLSFPFLHADRIVTPTLFLAGESDFNVPLLNSEQMYQALRSLGRPTELVIYPGQYHGLKKPSYVKDRWARYLAWYAKYVR